MVWSQVNPDKAHVAYAVIAVFSTVFSLCSLFVKEKLYLGEASAATIYGLVVGPHVLNWFNPISWGNYLYITLEISRVLLCIEIVAVAVELPKKYVWKHWFSLFLMLIPGMTAGWLIIGSFIYLLIPGLHFTGGLLISACITATDPVLAQPIVGKGTFAKRVPAHLRNLLSAESGCNDGISVPFVFLSLNLIMHHGNSKEIAKEWICVTVLYECALGLIMGAAFGYAGRVCLKYAKKSNLVDYESSLAFYIMLALFCAGFGSILGVDDLLASFAAGTAFNWDGSSTEESEESPVSTVIDILLNMAYFVYLGSIIPWKDFNNVALGLGVWRLIILAVCVIFLRRIPAVFLMKWINPDIKDWKEALFVGHFGPIGVGAVFAAIIAIGELEAWVLDIHEGPTVSYPANSEYGQLIQVIWPIVCFLIITSIIVHGSSVAVLTLGRHLQTMTFTYTYTIQKTSETDGGTGKKWLNRLPRLERSGTSFSLKRIDTISTNKEDDIDSLMTGNEKDKINSELNARIGFDENIGKERAKTTGIPVRPAGGAKRKQNRSKLKKLRKSKNGINQPRTRPALETLDLKSMSRHNTEFSTNNEGALSETDVPSPAKPKFSDDQATNTESPSGDIKYESDRDIPLSLVASNDGKSLVSTSNGNVDEELPIIHANPEVLKEVSKNFEFKPSDLEPVVDNDGLIRYPTKGYKYDNKLVIEDQLGEILRTVPSATSSAHSSSERKRSNTIRSLASALGVSRPQKDVIVVPDKTVHEMLDDDHVIETVGKPQVFNPDTVDLQAPERAAQRSPAVGSVKGILPKIMNIGNKLQPSDETIEKGIIGLVKGDKGKPHREEGIPIKIQSKSGRGSRKLHGFKVGDNIILEDDDGEIIRRFKYNNHKLDDQHAEGSSRPGASAVLNFIRPRRATVSAVDLEKQQHHLDNDDDNADYDEEFLGKKFEDKIRHFIHADKKNAIVRLPSSLEAFDYDDDYDDDDDDDDDDIEDDDNDDDVHSGYFGRTHSPVRGVTRSESRFERERRLGALHQSKRESDDEEDAPTTKY